jgi:hypothetical protein
MKGIEGGQHVPSLICSLSSGSVGFPLEEGILANVEDRKVRADVRVLYDKLQSLPILS